MESAPQLDHAAAVGGVDDDAAALARIRGGDTAAYALIMRRYNQRLYRIARSILGDDAEAQDAMQEAYVRAFFSLGRFAGPQRLGPWLARITINEALMRKRKQKRHAPLASEDEPMPAARPVSAPLRDPEQAVANGQLRDLIEQAVERLPGGFRTVFVLRAMEQLSVRETAQCLGIPEATVKTRFHRARQLVQERLRRQLDAAQLEVFEFAGRRCDNMVAAVLARIGGMGAANGVH